MLTLHNYAAYLERIALRLIEQLPRRQKELLVPPDNLYNIDQLVANIGEKRVQRKQREAAGCEPLPAGYLTHYLTILEGVVLALLGELPRWQRDLVVEAQTYAILNIEGQIHEQRAARQQEAERNSRDAQLREQAEQTAFLREQLVKPLDEALQFVASSYLELADHLREPAEDALRQIQKYALSAVKTRVRQIESGERRNG